MDIQNVLNIISYPKDIPSWMGLALDASFSFIVSFIAYMAWLKSGSLRLVSLTGTPAIPQGKTS